MDTLQHVFDVVGRFEERPYLIDSVADRAFTFGEFHRLACSLAAELRHRGVRRGDRVAIVLNNCPEFAMLYFSCLYLGAVAVPINLQLHQREIDFILKNSGPKMVVYAPPTKPLITSMISERNEPDLLCVLTREDEYDGGSEGNVWSVEGARHVQSDGWKPFAGVSPADLLSIMFTSGTTSLPKGVSHRIESLLKSAIEFNQALEFGPENRFYHVLAMAYMAGFLNTLLCPFLAGGSVVLTRGFDARQALEFWDAPAKYEVNTLWLVPAMLSALMQIDRSRSGLDYCRKRIETVCVGTAPLPLNLKRDFEDKYGVQLFESYGLSETLFVTTNSRKVQYLAGSVGPALSGVILKVVDEGGIEVPHGQDGEICIRTPFLMSGYLNHQTLQTDPADPHDWFPSGDIGHLTREGYLFITGRKKDLIIRGGINISPRAIEDLLAEHESVAQVSVVGIPHHFYGEEVVVVVKLKHGATFKAVRPSLEALCRQNLSSICVPTKFFALDEFPTSTTGKVQKAKLREMLSARLGTQTGY